MMYDDSLGTQSFNDERGAGCTLRIEYKVTVLQKSKECNKSY
jgi:hypothetical protein